MLRCSTLRGSMSRRDSSVLCHFIAGLRLSAVVNGMPLMINQRERLLHIPIGSRVEVNCTGAGLRSWSRSSSSEDIIPSETLSDANVFQISNRRDDQQVLVFQNFSAMDVGLYTCRSNLTINDNILQESIFITDCELYSSLTCEKSV